MQNIARKCNLKMQKYFQSLIWDNETGGHLNYITLHIRDKTMRDLLDQAFAKKFDSFFWYATILLVISQGIINAFNFSYDIPHKYPILIFLLPTLTFDLLLWGILKLFKHYKYSSKIIHFLLTLEICLFMNLSLRNLFPGINIDV